MRILLLPLVLGLASCNAVDNAAQETGNVISDSGNIAVDTATSVANAVENGASNIGNTIEGAVNRDAWIGRWTGVEGTYLVVSTGATPGQYRLEMQYTLDDKGTFDGVGTAGGIGFTRPDGPQVLRTATGDETGLRYLAGKKDCLMVKSGEGYCRD